MKKVFSLFLLLISFCANYLQAQEYSTSVSFISSTENILTVQSVCLSDKRGEAVDMAIRSAFYTLFYHGVSGFNNDKPLIQYDNKYYVNRFLTERYMMYVSSHKELKETERIANIKKYKALVEVHISIKNLIHDLTIEKLIDISGPKDSAEEPGTDIALPTITIVPYTKGDETIKEVLESDADLRMAIAKVREGFNLLGATTIDFEARLKAIWRSRDINASAVQSEEKKLLENLGADVYVVLDFTKDLSESEGSRVSLNMNAYSTATSEVLSSSSGWTKRFYTTDLDELCVYAVEEQLKNFLGDLYLKFAETVNDGKSIALHIERLPNSKNTLETEVGADGYALSSIIRRWVRSNSQGGQYHNPITAADKMFFDYIKIPAKDVDGLPMDVAQFGDNLLYFLKTEMKIPCKMIVDGNTIYINLM